MSGIDGLALEGGVTPDGASEVTKPAQEVEAGADLEMVRAELERSQRDVGNLQSLTEKLLKMSGQPKETPKSPEELAAEADKRVEDFEKDPDAFIREEVKKALEESPEVQEAQEVANQLRADKAVGELTSKVPDFKEVFSDPGFKSFLEEKPTYGKILVAANASFDVETIVDVIGAFKATTVETKDKKGNPLRVAKKGGGSGSGKKILSRDLLKKLIVEDPREYARLGEEISLAYKEGRVQ